MKQIYLLKSFIITLAIAATGYSQCVPPPAPIASGPANPICAGTTATLTASTGTGTLAWFNTSSGGTSIGTGGSFVTAALPATTSFWVEAQTTSPGTPQSGGAKLAPSSTGGSVVNAASDPWGLSFNATSDFTLNSVDVFLTSGTAGTVVMHLKDIGFNTLETMSFPVPAGGTNANPVQHTIPVNLFIPVGTGYRLVVESGPAMIRDLGSNAFPYPIGTVGSVTGGTINNANTNVGVYYFLYNWNYTPGSAPCASPRTEVVVNVNAPVAVPTASPQSFCGTGTVGGLQAVGTDLKWYSLSSGGTELTDGTALVSGNYYVSQTVSGCESARTTVSVTVTPIPVGPTANAQSFCTAATVSQLTANGTNLNWYPAPDNNAPLSGEATLETGTYYVSQTINNCEGLRTPVSVTITQAPGIPEASAQAFCGEGTVSQLTATGTNIQWYATEASTTALTGDTALVDGTYYVTQTVGDCESSRIGVTVTLNPIPDAPVAGENVLCIDSIAGDLEAEGENLQWYATETSTEPLNENQPVVAGNYYVSQTVNGCESARTEVNVMTVIIPMPVGDALQDYTAGETLADLDFTGSNLTWYTVAGIEIADTTELTDGATYYVTQTVDGCESETFEVTVNEVLSVGQISLSGLSFYPNPVTDKLNISYNSTISNIVVYNIQGQKLYQGTGNSNEAALDFSAYAAGTYLVQVSSGEASTTLKVVKQ